MMLQLCQLLLMLSLAVSAHKSFDLYTLAYLEAF
jgi:hypothetical protein